MSDGAGRTVGGTLVEAVLPGMRQVRAGRTRAGWTTVGLWLGLWGVVLWRLERVASAWRGPLDHRVALGTVILGILGAWIWSWRESRGQAPGRQRAGDDPGPGTSPWAGFWNDSTAVVGLYAVALVGLAALLTPFLAPFEPNLQGDLVSERFLSPSASHPLGTDNLARDVLSRLLYGARISLAIGVLAVSISVTVGTGLGALAGFVGGRVDSVIMRFVDMVLAFPRLVLLIAVVAVLEPSLLVIVAVLGLTLWPSTARLVRGEVLSLRERDFVVAARGLGYSRRRILMKHLVPNALGPVIVAATLGIGDTIVLEAGLSFLGLGVQAPTASWGSMVDAGRVDLLGAWWISTFPGLAIVVTVLSFNLVGDGLRDALDPRAG